DGWVNIRITNSAGGKVDPPRLARNLAQAIELGDPGVSYSESPLTFREADVEQLVDTLVNPARESLVFVAGTNVDSVDLLTPFTKQLERWTRQGTGLAQVVVLDPRATIRFAELTGTHGVAPWSVRTYLPQLDLADPDDARRHR